MQQEKPTRWQDTFRKYTVKKCPDSERGGSVGEMGRTHIPPRPFKESVHLNHTKEQIVTIISDTNLLKKYNKAHKEPSAENAELEKKPRKSKENVQKGLEIVRRLSELEELRRTVAELPPEVLHGDKENDGA